MDITPLGHASFKIRGKQTTVVTDPYSSDMVGLKFPKHTTADIVTVSHQHKDHNAVSQLEGAPFVISGPGEYEIKGTSVVGFSTFHDGTSGKERGANTIYRIEIDGVSIVHLGDLGHVLSASDVDGLDGVDILLVPTGGFYTIDAKQASQVISEIEPNIVIPMHYGCPGLNQKTFRLLAPVSDFLKEMGKVGIVPVPKLTISKDKLPSEMQLVVLE